MKDVPLSLLNVGLSSTAQVGVLVVLQRVVHTVASHWFIAMVFDPQSATMLLSFNFNIVFLC